MLRSLHISNYVLIESLDINFTQGLGIITGQTGAGKSILLGALSLLRGAKADATSLLNPELNCVIEAEFDAVPQDEALAAILQEADVDQSEPSLIVRRTVAPSGRSRAFVNDIPVPVQTLQALGALLVDIHSQHQSLLLTDKKYQLSILDYFASNQKLLSTAGALYREIQSDRTQLSAVLDKLSRAQQESAYNQARWQQLEDAKLKVGEMAALEEEQKQLSNVEEIRACLAGAFEALSPSADEIPSVSAAIREASRSLQKLQSSVPATVDLCARLDSSRLELEDIADTVEILLGGINEDPDRLQTISDRLSLLYTLFQKFGCRTEEELIAQRDALSELLWDSTELENKKKQLEDSISAKESEYDAVCARLTESRKAAAEPFAKEIQEAIHFLELDRAVFQVQINPAPAGVTGKDSVVFLFSANSTAPADLAQCASGGEMSRVMLCLKALMARFVGMPTMIFDEIDTGVSGSAADKMGSMICSMGKDMQVIAITHLPQVAAKGDAHYLVSKNLSADGRVLSGIKRLSREERIMEIARLLSGESITSAAIANAESLISDQGNTPRV